MSEIGQRNPPQNDTATPYGYGTFATTGTQANAGQANNGNSASAAASSEIPGWAIAAGVFGVIYLLARK